MSGSIGTTVVCSYRVKPGSEVAFEQLLQSHQPTLRRLGLITDRPTHVLRRGDDPSGSVYVEVFEWVDLEAADRAAEAPAVIAVWEPMAAMCESRDGQPAMEFPRFHRLG